MLRCVYHADAVLQPRVTLLKNHFADGDIFFFQTRRPFGAIWPPTKMTTVRRDHCLHMKIEYHYFCRRTSIFTGETLYVRQQNKKVHKLQKSQPTPLPSLHHYSFPPSPHPISPILMRVVLPPPLPPSRSDRRRGGWRWRDVEVAQRRFPLSLVG